LANELLTHVNAMRDFLTQAGSPELPDRMKAAQQAMRPPLRKRFYRRADVEERAGGFQIVLDGRPARTPSQRLLMAPTAALARDLAAEWAAQRDVIDPATMPLTRLSNSIIDGVADHASEIAAEIEKYLTTDLVFYRSETPAGLAERQALAWDPVLAWTSRELDANFVATCGMSFVAQPEAALKAARGAIPGSHWRLGALHAATTLMGSALLALALARGAFSLDQAWSAAHVDEDWNMEQWGRDPIALDRRASRFAEMQAAAAVLKLVS
jgi:chaperone required for assembly of F1-ATPase